MAQNYTIRSDQQTVNLATVGGVLQAASTKTDYDIYVMPKPIKNFAMQVSIVTSAVSNSLVSLGVKLLAGIDGDNWLSLLYFSVSDTTNASTSIYKWVWSTPAKYFKISVAACSYSGTASTAGTASFNALFMPLDFI